MMLETTESKMGISGNLLRTYQNSGIYMWESQEKYEGKCGEPQGKQWRKLGKNHQPCQQHYRKAKLGDAMRLTGTAFCILNLSCQKQIKTQLTFTRKIICKDKTTCSATSNKSFPESIFQSYVNIHRLQIQLPLVKTQNFIFYFFRW